MSPTCEVLVVDDEPVVRDAVRLVLEDAGYRVAVAPDAEAALAHPALAECALVLCDLMLPGGSGIEALRAIRARRPDLPVVLVSGYATAANSARGLEQGAAEFLAKPFDDLELLNLVRRVLAPARAVGEEDVP